MPRSNTIRIALCPPDAALLAGLLLLASSTAAEAQTDIPGRVRGVVDMSGPRFGLTVLSQGSVDALLRERNLTIRPLIAQFGWQFERRFYTNENGSTVLTEWVPLISGLEQGVALPSLNWLVGVRTPAGSEFGIGPNVTPLGVGLVVAAGVTVKSGAIHVPLNVAVATSKNGARISILTGFNLRR